MKKARTGMEHGFQTEPLCIAELFSNPFLFDVPSFQRPFCWAKNQAGQLLEDLLGALDEVDDKDAKPAGYFLGAILLMDALSGGFTGMGAKPSDGARRRFEIVDGLQRIATLVIMLSILRDLDDGEQKTVAGRIGRLITSRDTKRRQRLVLRGKESSFFERMVQRPGASDAMPEDGETLNDAERQIMEVREHLAGEIHDMSPARRAQLADFICDRCVVVVMVAASIDRAHSMFTVLNGRGMELARNDILKAEILSKVPQGDRERCLASWDEMRAGLGSEFEHLFSHIRTIHGRPKVQIIASIREITGQAGGGSPFIDDILLPAATSFATILSADHSGSAHSSAIRRSLTYLGWMKGVDWVPPAIYWINHNRDDPALIAAFLHELERFSLCLRVLGLGAVKRAGRYRAVLNAMRDGNLSEPSALPMRIQRNEQRHILYNLRNLHDRNQAVCKLVLARLSSELAGDLEGFAPGDFTVEHVLPRKPGRGSEWRKWYANQDLREQCTVALGNLLLITKKQNARAGNGEFSKKLDAYFNTPGQPVIELTNMLRGIDDWRPDRVQDRERVLIEMLRSMWQIDIAAEKTLSEVGARELAD